MRSQAGITFQFMMLECVPKVVDAAKSGHSDLLTSSTNDPNDETCTSLLETIVDHFFDRGLN